VVLLNVMRSVGTRGLGAGAAIACAVLAGAVGTLGPGCRAELGPYACSAGYASCLPGQNLCETSITTDGLNCGACGSACPLGARCSSGVCGTAVPKLVPLPIGSQSAIAVNSTGVFWSDSGSIYSAGLLSGSGSGSGGGATAPMALATDAFTCGSSIAFAVDDGALYYWSTGFNCAQPPNCGGLTKVSLADGTRTILVPNPTNPTAGSASPNQCGSMAVDAANVYLLATRQQGSVSTQSVYSAPLAGAPSLTLLATVQGSGGPAGSTLAVTPAHLVFQVSNSSGPPSFEVVPLNGGAPFSIPLPPITSWGGAFAADADNIYVAGSGCPCGNGSNSSGPPGGGVSKIAIRGGTGAQIAQFSGEAGGIAADATTVYWATDTTLWKVPKAGGGATEIAGNLTGGVPGFQCTGSCGGGSGLTPISIALDATSVYLADHGNVNAVLKVAK
jgi:hypothetical protein